MSLKHPSLVGGYVCSSLGVFNTLRPRQNGRHFADAIFNCVFLNENVWIPITISLKFVPKGQINHIQALVQIMAWRRPGDKPLSEPMMVSLPTHICVIRPQWVNPLRVVFSEVTKNVYISVHSSTLTWHRELNSFLKWDKNLSILQSQYHGYWCPGDARSQGISNHRIYYVQPDYFGPRTLRVNWSG